MATTLEKNGTIPNIQRATETLSTNLQDAAHQAGQTVRELVTSANDEICQVSDKVHIPYNTPRLL
jgi:hypothetical protein